MGWQRDGVRRRCGRASRPRTEPGASIWIESVSQSAGLDTYLAIGKYGVNANNTTTVDPAAHGYTGIFGTAGSSTRWQWDYQMDHNTYAVPWADLSPNQQYTATYKVYVGDSHSATNSPPQAARARWKPGRGTHRR